MKMTFENDFGIHTVELHKDVLAVDEVIGGLVIPVLLAAGYFDESIRNFIEVDKCTDAFVWATPEYVYGSN